MDYRRCRRIRTGRRVAVWTVFLLLLSAVPVPQARADGKVGMLNFQHVLTSLRGMEGGRVEGDVRIRADEITALERELRSIKERYGRERAGLSREERERYEQQIRQRSEAIQGLYAETVREGMFKVRLRSVEAVRADLERFIQRFGRERGFALILDRKDRRVLYRGKEGAEEGDGAGEIDITRTLMELLPQELGEGRIGGGASR